MSGFGILALIGVIALFVAWIVNALVGLLGSERRHDTGRLWLETVLRIFAVIEFGVIGRIVNYSASVGWPLKLLYAMGTIGILLLLIRGCRD